MRIINGVPMWIWFLVGIILFLLILGLLGIGIRINTNDRALELIRFTQRNLDGA